MNARTVAGALAGALCLVAGWSLAGTATAGGRPPTTVGVRNGASEFSFSLSRTKVNRRARRSSSTRTPARTLTT